MEKKYTTRRALAAAGLLVLGGGALAGCSEPSNYSGSGNEFVVRGIVHDTDDGTIHINEEQISVESAAGKAIAWFPEHKGQNLFSEEFNFVQSYTPKPGGFLRCGHDETVGQVHDQADQPISPDQLQPGTVIELTGSIRDETYWQSTGKSGGYCNDREVAVYSLAVVIERPLG